METQFPSPNGHYLFHINTWEAQMSLWVDSPLLMDVVNEKPVFDLSQTNWSLDTAVWLDWEKTKIYLRRYPGDHTPPVFEITIDCQAKQANLDGKKVELEALETTLEALYNRSRIKS
jgi:hypothetical protein